MAVEVRALIKQLGSDKFADRNNAMGKLGEFGPGILPILEKEKGHADPEVRHRLSVLRQILREDDFKNRLEAFAAGREGLNDTPMPFWGAYSKLTGDSPGSRALFVSMLRAEGDLLQKLHARPGDAVALTSARAIALQQQINMQPTGISFPTIATLLLLGSEVSGLPQQSVAAIFGLCYQTSLQTALSNDLQGAAAKKLLGAWIEQGKDWSAYQAISLSLSHNLPSGLTPALRVLKEGPAHVHIRQYAILAVARFGDKSHTPVLEKLLTDKTVCGQLRGANSKVIACQIRDVALAALLVIYDQKPKAFGFSRYQTHPTTVFVATTAGFETEEEREAVHAKWAAFKATAGGQ